MVDLSGKLSVVSGGARDIGRAISIQLAKCGASVAFCYHESAKEAEETAEAIRQLGTKTLAVKVDVTKWTEVEAFIQKIQDTFQRPIDIVVNNAGGIFGRKKMEEIDETLWDLVMDTNVKSTFFMCKAAVLKMNDGGTIVNMSSQAARDGGGSLVYGTSKGAVLTFTRGLAKELGPRRIRVNAVCPGMIDTTFHDKFTKPEIRQRVAAMTPLGREGEAEEVAALVAYLASSDSSYVNGAGVDINGGLLFS